MDNYKRSLRYACVACFGRDDNIMGRDDSVVVLSFCLHVVRSAIGTKAKNPMMKNVRHIVLWCFAIMGSFVALRMTE